MSKFSIVEHITNYMRRPNMGDPKHPTLWPSEASAIIKNQWDEDEVVGACRRSTYFRYALSHHLFNPEVNKLDIAEELQAKEIPPDKYMLWIWAAGQLFEEYVINKAKESGIFVAEQIVIYIREFNVSGKVDLVTLNPETSKFVNAEIKSVYGHNADKVIGTASMRKHNQVGQPRDSNLMQIALYEWWNASQDEQYEYSSLIYGARDTGVYAEFKISTDTDEEGTIYIEYEGIAPYETPKQRSPITINSILIDGYQYVEKHFQAHKIPPRDYDLEYSPEKIQLHYERGLLGKGDSERIEKIAARKIENEARIAEGKKELKDLLPVTKGDWQCRLCKWKNVCYSETGEPKEL